MRFYRNTHSPLGISFFLFLFLSLQLGINVFSTFLFSASIFRYGRRICEGLCSSKRRRCHNPRSPQSSQRHEPRFSIFFFVSVIMYAIKLRIVFGDLLLESGLFCWTSSYSNTQLLWSSCISWKFISAISVRVPNNLRYFFYWILKGIMILDIDCST